MCGHFSYSFNERIGVSHYEKNIVKAVLAVYFIHLPIQKNFHETTSKIVDMGLKKYDIISCKTSTNKENNTSQK